MITPHQHQALINTAHHLHGARWQWRGWQTLDATDKRVDCLFATFWLLYRARIIEHPGGGRNYYPRNAGVKRRQEENLAEKFLREILHVQDVTQPEDGDIVVFRAGRQSSHIGVVVEGGIAHIIEGKRFGIDPPGQWAKFIHKHLRVTNPNYKKPPSEVDIQTL